jgi:hypothetical protein
MGFYGAAAGLAQDQPGDVLGSRHQNKGPTRSRSSRASFKDLLAAIMAPCASASCSAEHTAWS